MDHNRSRGSCLVLSTLLLLAAFTVVNSQSPKEFSGLLQQEEHAEQARRVILGDWCQSQLARQTAQRNELRALSDQVAPLVGDDSNLHELSVREENLGGQLEQRQSDAAESESTRSRTSAAVDELRKQVVALSRVQERLPKDQRRKNFLQGQSGDDGGVVVATLLQQAQSELHRLTAELAQHEPIMLQREVGKLEAEHQAALDGLASLHTRQLAARKSQELIMAALEEQESFLTDLNDICDLGQQVYGRFETKTFPAMKDVAKELPSMIAEASEAARAAAAHKAAAEDDSVREAPPPADDSAAPTALLQPEESEPPPAAPTAAVPSQPRRARRSTAPRARHQQQELSDAAEPAAEASTEAAEVSAAAPSQEPPADSMADVEPATAAPRKLKRSRSTPRKTRKKSRRSAKVKVKHTQLTTTSAPDMPVDDNVDADAETAGESEPDHTKQAVSDADTPPPQSVRHVSSEAQKVADSTVELADDGAAAEEAVTANDDEESGIVPKKIKRKSKRSAPAARHTTTRAPVETPDVDSPSSELSNTEEVAGADTSLPEHPIQHGRSQKAKPAASTDDMGEVAENSPAADEAVSDSNSDSLDSASLLHVPKRKSRQRQQQHPLQDMVDVAAGARKPDFDDKSMAAPDIDEMSSVSKAPSDHDFLASSSGARSLKGLEGGWKSFLKGSKRKKKHKTHDQGNGIMDLVNTPTTYTAWHPEHSDAQYTAAAKSDLKAAEAAFDAPDDAGPTAFLQLRSQEVLESRRADTAKLLLEQYAEILKSPILLQLARAKLGADALQNLWMQLQSVNISVARSDHEAQSVQWCSDFQVESKSLAKKTRAEQRQAALDRSEADTELLVLSQEIKAHSHFLEIASSDERSLGDLRERVQHQFDSTVAVLQQFRGEASGILNELNAGLTGYADGPTHLSTLQESLGRIQGEVDSGNTEITDIINTAASRRSRALAKWKENLAQVQAKLADVQRRKAALAATSEAQELAKDQSRSLRDRYNQMCQWVLGEYQERQRQQESEKYAIKAALIVLHLL